MGAAMNDRSGKAIPGPEPIAVAPPGKALYVALGVIFALGPVAILLASLSGVSGELPAERLPAVLGLVVLIELPIVALLGWIATRRAADVSDGRLDVRAAFYRKRVPLADLDLDGARIVDLREKRELRPGLKTNGYALPGFAAGHFRDRQGNRLFCLVTRPRNLWLPLSDGSRMLLSAEHPTEALQALRERAWSER